jgi:replication factor C subunit 3/5
MIFIILLIKILNKINIICTQYHITLVMTSTDNDNLPFVERYRPKILSDVLSHHDVIETLKEFLKTQNIPHFLLYGPPGTGKTSTIHAFLNELYGEDNMEFMVKNINASGERGIEVVRNKISNFVKTAPVYREELVGKKVPIYKFVILDEADAMTPDAQSTLRNVIETYTYNARFCLICNHIKGIDEAIKSRCTRFKFGPLEYSNVAMKVREVAEKNSIEITEDGIYMIWKLSNGDMRKIFHLVQIISTTNKFIDKNIVAKHQQYPNTDDTIAIFNILMEGDFTFSYDFLRKIVEIKSYSLEDIIKEFTEKIVSLLIDDKIDSIRGKFILTKLRDIEMNIIVTSNTDIQLSAIVSAFNNYLPYENY